MSIQNRTLVFSTFFGSCIAIGLLLVSLTTNHWVEANPRRGNHSLNGEISYGLFYGKKELNYGIGLRSQPVDVISFIRTEHDYLSFWLWLLTTLGTGFGLLACTIAAIAAVLKAASAAKKQGTMVVLLFSNISAALAQVVAFISWFVQFYQYLTHNVLLKEDRVFWHSNGLAYLGYSFYLVVASTLIVLINITILLYVRRRERWDRKRLQPIPEEKHKTSIMLY